MVKLTAYCSLSIAGGIFNVSQMKIIKIEENTIERTMLTTPRNPPLPQSEVSGSLRFSERDVDFAYLCGVFNVSGIDGLHKEIQRLKAIGKDPHDIIDACGKQRP
jgi:hypothetical protein